MFDSLFIYAVIKGPKVQGLKKKGLGKVTEFLFYAKGHRI